MPRASGALSLPTAASWGLAAGGSSALDWLRALHARAPRLPAELQDDFRAFVAEGGDAPSVMRPRCRRVRAQRIHRQYRWGAGYRPRGPARFAQWLAARSWARCRHVRADRGCPSAIVADLAVGFDPAGAEAAAWPQAILRDLVLGAHRTRSMPPARSGESRLRARGLRDSGYAPWLELLRAVMRDRGGRANRPHPRAVAPVGGPAGGDSADGVYLRQPFDDLLRLLALESWRQRAVSSAKTSAGPRRLPRPHGRARRARHRRADVSPATATVNSSAGCMAPGRGCHHYHPRLPTLAGWRAGRDLEAHAPDEGDGRVTVGGRPRRPRRGRATAAGARRRGAGRHRAATDDWLQFVSASPSPLALLPLEDALGLREQPNLPGTTDGHPNWRRRLPEPLPGHAGEQAARLRGETWPRHGMDEDGGAA